jgi:hypothetical protein
MALDTGLSTGTHELASTGVGAAVLAVGNNESEA